MNIEKTMTTKVDKTTLQTQSSTATVTKNVNGDSFKDALSLLPDLDISTETKSTQQKTQTNEKNTNNTKNDFEFISTNFKDNVKTNNLNQTDNKNMQNTKVAEKELAKEIVLMNKQSSGLEKTKTEQQLAQAKNSTNIKSDDEIKAEKKDVKNDLEIITNLNLDNIPNKILAENNHSDIKSNIEINAKNEDVKNDLEIITNLNSDNIHNETLTENRPSNIKSNENIILNDISANLQQNNTENIENIVLPIIKKETNVIDNINSNTISSENIVEVINKSTNKDIISIPKEISPKQPQNNNTVVESFKSEQITTNEKRPLFNDKLTIKNNKLSKKEPLLNSAVAGEVENVVDDIALDATQQKINAPEMKIITIEPASPLFELNKTLSTTKTTDIVQFIDANLSTTKPKEGKITGAAASTSKKTSNSAEKTSIKMTEADANFFNNIIQNNEQVMQGTKVNETQNNLSVKDVEEAQSAKVSQELLNALKESQEKNKPFRIDFDKDISVILKVNKDGQISAEFIPGDKAVEQYLKSNIPLLKQKFDEQELDYENLSYRNSRKDNEQNEKRNRREKENSHE